MIKGGMMPERSRPGAGPNAPKQRQGREYQPHVSMKLHPQLRNTDERAFRHPAPSIVPRPGSSMSWLEKHQGSSIFRGGKTHPARGGNTGRRTSCEGAKVAEEGADILHQAVQLSKGMDAYIDKAEGLKHELLEKTRRTSRRTSSKSGRHRSKSDKTAAHSHTVVLNGRKVEDPRYSTEYSTVF